MSTEVVRDDTSSSVERPTSRPETALALEGRQLRFHSHIGDLSDSFWRGDLPPEATKQSGWTWPAEEVQALIAIVSVDNCPGEGDAESPSIEPDHRAPLIRRDEIERARSVAPTATRHNISDLVATVLVEPIQARPAGRQGSTAIVACCGSHNCYVLLPRELPRDAAVSCGPTSVRESDCDRVRGHDLARQAYSLLRAVEGWLSVDLTEAVECEVRAT